MGCKSGILEEAWVRDISEIVENRELSELGIKIVKPKGSNCLLCRGSRLLCGKTRCPVILRWASLLDVSKRISSTSLLGSSPPGVFVGRIGYPYVYAGPLIPPERGDTSYFENQSLWFDLNLDSLVNLRANLIRGSFRVRVDTPSLAGRLFELTQEMSLAEAPVDCEATFIKPPFGRVVFDSDAQPFGPSGLVESLRAYSMRVDRRLERAFSDTDMKATEGMLELYFKGVNVYSIQRALSVGALGDVRRRKLVPTRWSITAVDSTLGLKLIEDIKLNPTVNDYLIFSSRSMDNSYVVLLAPGDWSYELVEIFHPGSVWNRYAEEIAIGSDFEGRSGRTTYARIGGCYYAARLAVAEFLYNIKKQATVVVLREAKPGYVLPVGVWHVREGVRRALSSKPAQFSNLRDVVHYISTRIRCPTSRVIRESTLFRSLLSQSRLSDFIKKDLAKV
ncbi:MAG: Nre family DNA repair protein [Candidatus Bathyarchaeia archaeon]